ncbi:MAG: hypothetical protein LC739_04500 [Actinobacteria bacterium]|nr:hypothetical protein [Actinomycetota bacterium]
MKLEGSSVPSPSGTGRFDDLIRTTIDIDLEGLTVKLGELEDLLRMKRASARPKDLLEVEVLTAVRENDRDQVLHPFFSGGVNR